MWPFFSSLIGAGSSLLGGLFGRSTSEEIAQQNIQQQLNFAQHGVQWRVNDARAAGINPLAALGISTPGFQNVVGDNSLGEGISKAGQDISRGVSALQDKATRMTDLEEKLVEAKIANVNADTTRMLASASAAARSNPPGNPPGVPLPVPDPRGPVINLMQRARDPRTGEIVWIPSEKAASPLQTLAAAPTNAALAGRGLSEGLLGLDGPQGPQFNFVPLRADAWRGVDMSQYAPF